MTASLFAAIALICLCMVLGYLSLGQIEKASQALIRLARSSRKPGAPPTHPGTNDAMAAVGPQQSRWTALDDRQFARFVRDSAH